MGTLKLLKFYADWCQPCKMLDRTLEDLQDNPLVANRENINIDSNIDLAQQYKIRGVPTMILVDSGGQELARVTGMQTLDKIQKFLQQ